MQRRYFHNIYRKNQSFNAITNLVIPETFSINCIAFTLIMCVLLIQLCPTICNPVDYSRPGTSVQGSYQAKYWSELPFPSPGNLPHPGIKPMSPALQVDSLADSNAIKKLLNEPSQRHRWFLFYREFLYLHSGSHLLAHLPDFYSAMIASSTFNYSFYHEPFKFLFGPTSFLTLKMRD